MLCDLGQVNENSYFEKGQFSLCQHLCSGRALRRVGLFQSFQCFSQKSLFFKLMRKTRNSKFLKKEKNVFGL